MKGATPKQFSEMHGVSRQTIWNWGNQKLIVKIGKLIDVEASDGRLRDAGLGRFAPSAGSAKSLDGQGGSVDVNRPPFDSEPAELDAKRVKPSAADVKPLESLEDGNPEQIEEAADAFVTDVLAGRYATTTQAERIKANALALKHVLDVRRRAGNLLDKAEVTDAAFRCARHARDAWLNWPSRVAPLIAADLGLEPGVVHELLAQHVHQQLTDLGKMELDLPEPEDA